MIPVLFQGLAIVAPCQDSCLNRGVRFGVFSSLLRHIFPVEYENHYKVFRYEKNNYEFMISYHEIVVLLIFAVGFPPFDSNVLEENFESFFCIIHRLHCVPPASSSILCRKNYNIIKHSLSVVNLFFIYLLLVLINNIINIYLLYKLFGCNYF